ncbi:helix-turn-helix domain-containing protein [Paenibacillus baekrokdamisoli]|nr:AraC family transcriptional regulator [Paenibacillus baekrokdamisoli]
MAASPPMHKHGCFELVYYKRGAGYTNIGGKRYDYHPHTFAIIRPNTPHDEKHEKDTEVFFIGFDYDDIPMSLHNGVYKDGDSLQIWRLLQAMKTEFLEKRSFHSLQLNLIGGQLMLELCRIPQIQTGNLEKEDRIIYAINFLKENYTQSVQLQHLAELSGYSFDRFRHAFKERTSLSPMNYIMMKRIERSIELLSSTRLKIAAIAVECGFSTPSQFSLLFKKCTGITPKEYREDPSALPAKPIFAED